LQIFPNADAAIRFKGTSGSVSDSTSGWTPPFFTTVSANASQMLYKIQINSYFDYVLQYDSKPMQHSLLYSDQNHPYILLMVLSHLHQQWIVLK
jgi:hypothetical protein